MMQAVLFEFDGVLADTRDARRRALLDTLEEDGVTIANASTSLGRLSMVSWMNVH